MTDRETVTETLKRWEEDFSVPAIAFIAELNALLATIPEELRSEAMLHFDVYGDDCDVSKGELYVWYERDATDEERRLWAQHREASERDNEARERATLERLRKKFG